MVLVMKVTATLLLALAALALPTSLIAPAAGAAGAGAAGAGAVPGCTVLHGAGPGYNASIGNSQNGKTVCITVGEKLLVILSGGSPNASPWHAIRMSKPGVLKIAPLTLMLSRGLTAANFQAVRAGRVQLTSERSPCTPTTSMAVHCNVIELWRVTVVVRASAP